MQFYTLNQPVSTALQRFDVMMRSLSIIEMTAQLRQATVDGFIRCWAAVPDFIDEIVPGNEIAIAHCERNEHFENFRFRPLLVIATAQHAFAGQDLPVAKRKSRKKIFSCRHPIRTPSNNEPPPGTSAALRL